MAPTLRQRQMEKIGYVRRLTVEGEKPSQMLRYFESCDTKGRFGDKFTRDIILGPFHGRIHVTAERRAIISAIRERLERMEKRLGCPLRFEFDDWMGKDVAGGKVAVTCYVYAPAHPLAEEIARFKQD